MVSESLPSLHAQLEAEGFGRQMVETKQPAHHAEIGAGSRELQHRLLDVHRIDEFTAPLESQLAHYTREFAADSTIAGPRGDACLQPDGAGTEIANSQVMAQVVGIGTADREYQPRIPRGPQVVDEPAAIQRQFPELPLQRDADVLALEQTAQGAHAGAEAQRYVIGLPRGIEDQQAIGPGMLLHGVEAKLQWAAQARPAVTQPGTGHRDQFHQQRRSLRPARFVLLPEVAELPVGLPLRVALQQHVEAGQLDPRDHRRVAQQRQQLELQYHARDPQHLGLAAPTGIGEPHLSRVDPHDRAQLQAKLAIDGEPAAKRIANRGLEAALEKPRIELQRSHQRNDRQQRQHQRGEEKSAYDHHGAGV